MNKDECEWCWIRDATVRKRTLSRIPLGGGEPKDEEWVICDVCVGEV